MNSNEPDTKALQATALIIPLALCVGLIVDKVNAMRIPSVCETAMSKDPNPTEALKHLQEIKGDYPTSYSVIRNDPGCQKLVLRSKSHHYGI